MADQSAVLRPSQRACASASVFENWNPLPPLVLTTFSTARDTSVIDASEPWNSEATANEERVRMSPRCRIERTDGLTKEERVADGVFRGADTGFVDS